MHILVTLFKKENLHERLLVEAKGSKRLVVVLNNTSVILSLGTPHIIILIF
jgi:hypothetical protein